MTTPTPTIYRSRSRTTRTRLLIIAAVVALILVGWLIGRMQGSSPAAGSGLPPSAPASVPASSNVPSPEPPSPTPAEIKGGVDAYAPIQAESAAGQNGVQTQDTEDQGGGKNIGWVAAGDSLRFDNLNFGNTPATSLVARVASAVGDGVNGRMEIRIDSADSQPIGTLPIEATGGWQTWRSQATDITATTGLHTVFLTFAADRGDDFLNLNYVKFSH